MSWLESVTSAFSLSLTDELAVQFYRSRRNGRKVKYSEICFYRRRFIMNNRFRRLFIASSSPPLCMLEQ
jgi:hypothetical protein